MAKKKTKVLSRARKAQLKAARESKAKKRVELQREGQLKGLDKVFLLASRGAAASDIEIDLGLTEGLRDSAAREEFQKAVRRGHSRHNIVLSESIAKNIQKGRPSAQLKAALVWLEKYRESDADLWTDRVAGAEKRIMALIAKHRKAGARNKKDAAQV